MLNKWRCNHPGCEHTCVGIGGAIGLRAIGWQFIRGTSAWALRGIVERSTPATCYCPEHRMDMTPAEVRGEVAAIQEHHILTRAGLSSYKNERSTEV